MSWHVDAGETLAIVGESGSGKSVSAMTVMGLVPGGATHEGAVLLEGRSLLDLPEAQQRRLRGARPRDGLPGPADGAQPGVPRRRPDRRDDHDARADVEGRGAPAGRRPARRGRHPQPRAAGAAVPARVLRRYAAAGDDRDGAGQRPGRAHRGRADDRARRHRAGPDHGGAGAAAGRARHRDRADHPRPRPGRRARRPDRRHVRGPDRRGGRQRRAVRRAAPRLHGRPAGRADADGPGPAGEARTDPGPAAEPRAGAAGVRVPPAVPVRDGIVCGRGAAAGAGRSDGASARLRARRRGGGRRRAAARAGAAARPPRRPPGRAGRCWRSPTW